MIFLHALQERPEFSACCPPFHSSSFIVSVIAFLPKEKLKDHFFLEECHLDLSERMSIIGRYGMDDHPDRCLVVAKYVLDDSSNRQSMPFSKDMRILVAMNGNFILSVFTDGDRPQSPLNFGEIENTYFQLVCRIQLLHETTGSLELCFAFVWVCLHCPILSGRHGRAL